MLGQFEEATYRGCDLSLQAGDRILLYTDGITEATNSDDEDFSEQMLLEFMEHHGALPGDLFTDKLLKAVAVWAEIGPHREPEDDQTLVLVDVTK